MTGRVLSAGEIAKIFAGYDPSASYVDERLDEGVTVGDIQATLRAYGDVVAAARDAHSPDLSKAGNFVNYTLEAGAVERLLAALRSLPEGEKERG